MTKKWLLSIPVLFLVYILIGAYMSKTEQPKYIVRNTVGAIESREYQPLILAQVTTSGTRSEAIKSGFKILADYIFGNNIAMTAPVLQTKIDNGWRISFIMPSKYQISDLPQNPKINLVEIPKQTVSVISFSGRITEANLSKHAQIILQTAPKSAKLTYAFYNPPWTLPMLRRNEIMLDFKN